jgi:chaperone modulatory protein CbpM
MTTTMDPRDRNHHRDEPVFEAVALDETIVLRVDEVCARLRIDRQWVVELVELGALEPSAGGEPGDWRIAAIDVPRLRSMMRLVEDLGVNLAGAAIILELAEERRRLIGLLRGGEK